MNNKRHGQAAKKIRKRAALSFFCFVCRCLDSLPLISLLKRRRARRASLKCPLKRIPRSFLDFLLNIEGFIIIYQFL